MLSKPSKLSKLDQFKRLADAGYFRSNKRVWSFMRTVDDPMELLKLHKWQRANYPGLLSGWSPIINLK